MHLERIRSVAASMSSSNSGDAERKQMDDAMVANAALLGSAAMWLVWWCRNSASSWHTPDDGEGEDRTQDDCGGIDSG